jgi:hypothetical protein
MARGLDGMDFREQDEHQGVSPTFGGDRFMQKSSRIFWLKTWSDIKQAIPNALGYPTRTAPGVLSRYLPHQDPVFPFLVATSYGSTKNKGISLDTPDSDSGLRGNEYDGGIVLPLEFEKPLYHILEDGELAPEDTANYNGLGPRWATEIDRYVEYEETPESSYVTPPSVTGMMAWSKGQTGLGGEDNQSFPQNYSTILGEASIRLRWHQIPDDALPLDAIYACLGKVNQTNFGSKEDVRLGFNPWSMLFLGGSFTRIVLPTGDFGWTVEYLFKFSGSQKVWNYYLNARATTPGFYEVSLKPITGAGPPPTLGDAPFFVPGATNSDDTHIGNKISYGVANLNDLFVIA